jgi:hypothetical protein
MSWKFNKEGKSRSEIAKEHNFGKWMVGKKLSQEVINKCTESRLKNTKERGYYWPKETREKFSIKRQGEKNPFYGKTHSVEYKSILSKKGKEIAAHNLINNPNRTTWCRLGALATGKKLRLKRFTSQPEIKMCEILSRLGHKYIHHYSVINIEHKYIADFYLLDNHTILEIDGKYWHNYPNLRELDKIRNRELKEAGYNLIRLWDDEVSEELLKNKLMREGIICQVK